MTYNIRYDNDWDTENAWNDRKDNIVKLIKIYNPEFIGVQEALINQVNFIDYALKNHKYIGMGRDGGNRGEFSAIFYDTTEFKVLKNGTFWLSETPNILSVGWDAALKRICTYGLFKNITTGKKIWVFNTHFDHKGNLARKKSATLILKKIGDINTKNYPVVFMGDLNSTPKEKPIQIFKSQLTDTFDLSKRPFKGSIGTFNGFVINKPVVTKIDYIFIKKLNVSSYSHLDDRVNNKHISDHLPILATLNFKTD
ncbi:MAG: endonuclease/exonuclease/phosphatase family protein [Flavobacteriaceae bacterium]|nr:endonuclease/exonuclease/phosphatase family protein [Flavobacteriaceae bacterium]